MNLSTIGIIAGGVCLCGSLAMNAHLYRQYNIVSHENATLAANVDVLNAAREADAEAYCEKRRALQNLDGRMHERMSLLDQTIDNSGNDAELLDGLRGMFDKRKGN